VEQATKEVEGSQARLQVVQTDIDRLNDTLQDLKRQEQQVTDEITTLDNAIVTAEEERLELESISSAMRRKIGT